jgi:sodium/hydrogen exchanger-like protein 3
MFEAYVVIEEANIVAADIAKGFASFIVVAGGGTVIGIIWGYVTGFVTRSAHISKSGSPCAVIRI